MGYIYTRRGLGELPASLQRGAKGSQSAADTSTKAALPNLVVRTGGVTTTYTPSQAIALGYIFVKTPSPGHWEKKGAAGGDTATVTFTESDQSRCAAFGLFGVEANACAAFVKGGSQLEEAVCKAAGIKGQTYTFAGAPAGDATSLCAKDLRSGMTLAEVTTKYRGATVVRDKRYQTLLAECAAAGVPESQLEACVTARQQGASLEEAAGAAIAAGQGRTKMLLLLGGAGALGYFLWQRSKKGKKK